MSIENMWGWSGLATRLDLAAEATAVLRGDANVELPGISEDKREQDGVIIHTITVLNHRGEKLIHKPQGRYLTIELPTIDHEQQLTAVAQVLAGELAGLLPSLEGRTLLVAGLGNRFATPDALGPRVAEHTFATRHLFDQGELPGLNRVCVISTGVMGSSGLESAEILRGFCAKLKPAAVIAVDALAAASLSRVGVTIQMTDTGISPGSGVGNTRSGVNAEVCGCPVIAIGVPTVVDAAAIICETVAAVRSFWQQKGVAIPLLDEDACIYTEQSLLEAFDGQLIMTPKDIDQLIDTDATLLAAAVALAAHPAATAQTWRDFIR